jgi:hypothetical protein
LGICHSDGKNLAQEIFGGPREAGVRLKLGGTVDPDVCKQPWDGWERGFWHPQRLCEPVFSSENVTSLSNFRKGKPATVKSSQF